MISDTNDFSNSNSNSLGKWALIDLETTGLNPHEDKIIDVGFLEFNNLKLVRSFRSLVHYDGQLSYFIQKLTGIKQQMLVDAPDFKSILPSILSLKDHTLLAHNAKFEASFLDPFFKKEKKCQVQKSEEEKSKGLGGYFEDTLFYLALLFPHLSSLKLEQFITKFKIASKETHRGFEDSRDLLKVLLSATRIFKKDEEKAKMLSGLIFKNKLSSWWFSKFYHLSSEELDLLAKEIGFDLSVHFDLLCLEQENKNSESTHGVSIEDTSLLRFTDSNIVSIFSNEEEIRKVFPGYIKRQEQIKLARMLWHSFSNNKHALIQSPTGTGKTLGILVPAVLFTLDTNKQVVIATGTKALQNQALRKDLPILKRLLNLKDGCLKVVSLVGSQNHFCELSFKNRVNREEHVGDKEKGALFDLETFSSKFARLYFSFIFYLNSHSDLSQTLFIDSIPRSVSENLPDIKELLREIMADCRACARKLCPYCDTCTYQRSLHEARDANIIIANHSLMFLWPRSLDRPEYLVVDEAHRIERESTQTLSYKVNASLLRIIQKNLSSHQQGLGTLYYLISYFKNDFTHADDMINDIKEHATRVSVLLGNHLDSLDEVICQFARNVLGVSYTKFYSNELSLLKIENTQNELAKFIYTSFLYIADALARFKNKLEPFVDFLEKKKITEEREANAFFQFRSFFDLLGSASESMEKVLDRDNEDTYARSLWFHEKDSFELLAAPVDSGKLVHEYLLEPSQSVVFTSATLACGSFASEDVQERKLATASIEWSTGHRNLTPQKRYSTGLYLKPVYDYATKAKVFLCNDMPSISSENFVSEVFVYILPLIRQLRGRTLLLFSSRVRFNKARELLYQNLSDYNFFVQNEGHDVIENFKASSNAVLLGMESFAEGIDIPGDDLKFVFIDKIPDLPKDLLTAKREKFFSREFGDGFNGYNLAHRACALLQKFGRLLRTETDSGHIIVVDRRIKHWKISSLETFLNFLKPYKVNITVMSDACRIIKEHIEANPIDDHLQDSNLLGPSLLKDNSSDSFFS